ncbi:MAG: N,N'-diacetylchitobiose phosphorylase [bacterium]
MQYGYFDAKNREYVITRPDTPRPWSNYLGTREYGAIITNHAGGYSFYKSAALGRFLRLRFNSVPLDQPGRYFYLRDAESGDFWSASWQPVGKPLDQYKSICRHGTGYTVIESEYAGIRSETTYFVPRGQTFEYWRLRVTNTTQVPRQISLFSYCEFASNWSTSQDLVNLQYSAYITEATWKDGLLQIAINNHLPADPANFVNNDQGRWSWMTLVGAPVAAFDSDRDAFLGPYGTYAHPAALESGRCSGSLAYGDNACGSLQSDLRLNPGETREIIVMLGVGKAAEAGRPAVAEFGSPARCEEELQKMKAGWHAQLDGVEVTTPDESFNHMVNMWNPYNALITFAWSRSASLVYNGERDGLGFRDSVQDVLGVAAMIPDECRARLELLLTGQVSHGGAMPQVFPFSHQPGHETPPPPERLRSDDCLWFFNAVPLYVAETGDLEFYRKVLPFADQGEATVLEHLRRALEFNLTRTGRNGLPCGLEADWNDCLRLGYHGESVFVAFQVRFGLGVYAEVATRLGLMDEAAWAECERTRLDERIQARCWDGKWFIWAIGEDGTVYGSQTHPEGQVYLNTQVWAVMSGAATPEQARQALQAVKDQLATPYGLMLCAPPFVKTKVDVMRAVLFVPGTKENAGIFSHPQSWAVMAECLQGQGDQAYAYYRAFMPAAFNDRADVREVEPYVHCQSTHSRYSPRFGVSRVPWLSGTASWSCFTAMHYILGIRPELDGLRIDPCIPSSWPAFRVCRRFRGMNLNVVVRNPAKVCRGVKRLTVDGREQAGTLIPLDALRDQSVIQVELG